MTSPITSIVEQLRPQLGHYRRLARAHLRSLALLPRYANDFRHVQRYCMFIGYPRSGHSLIGSLLSAHPHCVIAHEMDALQYVGRGLTRSQLFALLVARDRDFTRQGRGWTDFDYSVDGLWQGRYTELKVIGDKKGGASTLRLEHSPHLLEELRRLVRVPLRIIHVVRNPYDNISTMLRRSSPTLPAAIDLHLRRCHTIAGLLDRGLVTPDEWLDVRLEDVVADPGPHLERMSRFLGLDPEPRFIALASRRIFGEPRHTRHRAPWTPALIADVGARCSEYPFLDGYSFDT
jgi:hypothetical protein